MKREVCLWQIILLIFVLIGSSFCAMTYKQLQQSMDMMRSACAPKFKVTTEQLNELRNGIFSDNREIKCYTLCIAQMSGTVTKKNELSAEKAIKQLELMAPADLRDMAVEAVRKCQDVQKQYKDLCDKSYYSVKCTHDYYPDKFTFP